MAQAKDEVLNIQENMLREIKEEMTENIKALEMPENLPSSVSEAYAMQNLFITKLGVKPENSIVMANEEDS